MKRILTVISVILMAALVLSNATTAWGEANPSAITAGRQVGLGVQANVPMFKVDPNAVGKEFTSDKSKYLVIYVKQSETIRGMEVQVQGPAPESVSAVYIFGRLYSGGKYSSWERLNDSDENLCTIKDGRFTCNIELVDAAFDKPYQLMVAERSVSGGDILDRAHTPALFLSEGRSSLVLLAEVGALLAFWNRDYDKDGVNDNIDNCIVRFNEDQGDRDNDGRGDACDNDIDHDGLINERDNCKLTKNPDQANKDNDALGDKCEITFTKIPGSFQLNFCLFNSDSEECKDDETNPDDLDGDGILNEDDECPDQAETYTFSSLRPTDGVLDGCPNSESSDQKAIEPDLGDGINIDGNDASDGGGCTLSGGTPNPIALILMALAFAPIAIRRKRSA